MAGMREPLGIYETSGEIKMGPFLDETDGITPLTSLTINQADVKLSKNNGAYTQKSDVSAAVHDENGWYDVTLGSSDTNTNIGGFLKILIHVTGALPVKRKLKVAYIK